MKTAFIFPGQGSQYVGMGKAFFDASPAARKVFDLADRALGEELSALCFNGPEEELKLTANTQPAILSVSIAALKAVEERGLRCDYVAGHSLGEYSALAAAGCLGFEDAVRAVRKRGQFMQESVPVGEGAMAALLGSDLETVREVCREASALGVCSPANINSPKQVVIAGQAAAVGRAVELARERGAKRAVVLPVSAPFHCELMRPAAERLAPVLSDVEFSDLRVPLVANAHAGVVTSGREARERLIEQVASPVLWSDSVGRLIDEGVTTFIEIGPGKVLAGLVRQVSRDVETFSVEDPESLDSVVAALGRNVE